MITALVGAFLLIPGSFVVPLLALRAAYKRIRRVKSDL
jgi:hypothetical protein